MSITVPTYTNIESAYDYFNARLFGGKLPKVLITLVPHKGAYGYYRHEAFKGKGKKQQIIHEIALNPFTFTNRSDIEIHSTLVHEMCHLQEALTWTERPKRLTHTRVWADMMKAVGLQPSTTGEEGGKETGRKCSHYVIKGGAFEKAAKKCDIQYSFAGILVEKEKKGSRRTKYTCPSCGVNAYGKEGLNLTCGDCDEAFEA